MVAPIVNVLGATELWVGYISARGGKDTSGKWTRGYLVKQTWFYWCRYLWLSQARDVPTDMDP